MTVESPTWTILVPTLGERAPLFKRLMDRLLPQVDRYGGRVRVAGWFNNGEPSLPEIRQRMVQWVSTDYLSFLDDDDLVPDYFVDEVMAALESRPDYVGFQVHYFANGKDHGLVDHSLRHGGWREEKNPYALLRDISHINPMRSDAAKMADFRIASRGEVEDRPWADQIRRDGLLQTEVYIPKPMYEYLWSRQGTRWRSPNRIRPGKSRAILGNPNFTWVDGIGSADERMVEDRGRRVPESRPGRRADHDGVGVDVQAHGISDGRGDRLQPQGDMVHGGGGQHGGSEAGPGVRPQHAVRRLAVVVPTRGRPSNIAKVLDAWDFTGAWADADLVLAIDADDPEADSYRALVRGAADRPLVTIYSIPEWTPMVPKLERATAAILGTRRYSAVGFAGDDHLPRTINWARRYLDVLGELGSGMVFGDDGYQGGNLSTEWAVSADLIELIGRMVPAGVEHMYCDNAILDLYDTARCARYLPEVNIEHMHPIAGKASNDAQYQRVNHRDQFKRDRATYELWKRRELPAQLAAVRAHRKDLPTVAVTRSNINEIPGRVKRTRTPFPRFFKQVKGVTPDEIGLALADMAAQVPADQAIVELGTYHGRTALQMSWGARQGNGAHLFAFDPWDTPGNVYGADMGDLDAAHRWAVHHVRTLGYANDITLKQAFGQDAGRDWTGGPVGLLFVDGDHTYAGAHGDVLAWAPHLADGATIAIDDYRNPNYPEVGEAIDALVADGILAEMQLFHDRLGVTRLLAAPRKEMSYQVTESSVLQPFPPLRRIEDVPALEIAAITSEGVHPSPVAHDEVDELFGVPDVEVDRAVDPGAKLGDLRAAAKRRNITGAAKMGREELLKALSGE